MTALFDLEGHLIFYRSYHFNHVNVAIHLFCIPIILLSLIAFLSPINLLGDSYPFINLGSLWGWSYGIFYILLDWKLGVPSFSFLVGAGYFFKKCYLELDKSGSIISQNQFVLYAFIAHIVSWLAQFYGHGVHEKRAPALLDNLLQALVLAPFFVVFELAFWLGYRRDLKKTMDNKAGLIVRDLKLKKASSKSM